MLCIRFIRLPEREASQNFLSLGGWSAFAYFAYKAATTRIDNKLYDPFEILGIRSWHVGEDIKSHYKKLSRKFHPDKVKLAINQTVEQVEAHFVDLTKAYKSLTDEDDPEELGALRVIRTDVKK